MFKRKYYVKAKDRTNLVWGKIEKGDKIMWWGNFFSGHNKNGKSLCVKYLTGINLVKSIHIEGNLVTMILDNKKEYIINNIRKSNYITRGWIKLN